MYDVNTSTSKIYYHEKKSLRERIIREMRMRNYSENTVRNYIHGLSKLAKYYNKSPDELTTDQVKDFAYRLIYKEKSSISVINQLISAWKILQEDILGNKWEGFKIKRPRREKKLPQLLSQLETISLVESPTNLKHRMLLKLVYVCGLRSAELLNIKLKDIDSARSVVRVVNGKGNKTREIPIPESLIVELRLYYRTYIPKTFLFEGNIIGRQYSKGSLYKIIRRAAKKIGLKKRPSAHILRHCFATHMLERGVNLKRLQLLLGHSSIKTTSIYLHLANIDGKDLPNILSPED